jgi:hypothetical protein
MVLLPKPEALKSRRARLEEAGEDSAKNPKMPAAPALFYAQDRDARTPTCAAILFYMLIL